LHYSASRGKNILITFYLCDAMLVRVYATAFPSVSLACHTRALYQNMTLSFELDLENVKVNQQANI